MVGQVLENPLPLRSSLPFIHPCGEEKVQFGPRRIGEQARLKMIVESSARSSSM